MPPKLIELWCKQGTDAPANDPRFSYGKSQGLSEAEMRVRWQPLVYGLVPKYAECAVAVPVLPQTAAAMAPPPAPATMAQPHIIEWETPWMPNRVLRWGSSLPTRYALLVKTVDKQLTQNAAFWSWKLTPVGDELHTYQSHWEKDLNEGKLNRAQLEARGSQMLHEVATNPARPVVHLPLKNVGKVATEDCCVCMEPKQVDRVWTCCSARACADCATRHPTCIVCRQPNTKAKVLSTL